MHIRGSLVVENPREADSPKVLRAVMRKEGVMVTEVNLAKTKAQGSGLNKQVTIGAPVSKRDIANFTRQLSVLLKAGVPLTGGLGVLVEQLSNVRFKSAVGEVRTMVNEGESFAGALGKHPKIFSELYISMGRAGESSGNLALVLDRLSEFLEKAEELKNKLIGAMIYPAIMVVVMSGIIIFLMISVVPDIVTIYIETGQDLPWYTELLIAVSNFFINYWYFLIFALTLFIILFIYWKKSPGGKKAWDGFALKAPLFGKLIRQVAVARFARTLGTLLASGVPMLQALSIAKDILGNSLLVQAVDDARKAVSEGAPLAATLRKTGHFPPTMTHMVAVGEQAGELENMLLEVAIAYEKEADMRIERVTAAIQPLMLLLLGGIVFFVVIALLVPLLDMDISR